MYDSLDKAVKDYSFEIGEIDQDTDWFVPIFINSSKTEDDGYYKANLVYDYVPIHFIFHSVTNQYPDEFELVIPQIKTQTAVVEDFTGEKQNYIDSLVGDNFNQLFDEDMVKKINTMLMMDYLKINHNIDMTLEECEDYL